MRLLTPALLLSLVPLLPAADDQAAAARILAWTKTLSADEFEGRAPGTRGEDRTVAYLEEEFRKLGLKPGNPDGTFVQKVPLAGITSRATLGFRVGATEMPLTPINDFVGLSTRITTRSRAGHRKSSSSVTASPRRSSHGMITRGPTSEGKPCSC